MKLYYSPGACSLSPHIVLRESGYAFDIEKVDLGTKKTESGADFKAINPKGYVPALALDDGQVVTEGPAIVQYLADHKPEARLAPANGTPERYRLQEWLNYITAELHKRLGSLFSAKMPDAWKAEVRTQVGHQLDYLSKALDGRAYLMGDTYTVADAYLFTVLGWTGYVDIELAKWPVLQAYVARVAERPAVQAALKAEGLAG